MSSLIFLSFRVGTTPVIRAQLRIIGASPHKKIFLANNDHPGAPSPRALLDRVKDGAIVGRLQKSKIREQLLPIVVIEVVRAGLHIA